MSQPDEARVIRTGPVYKISEAGRLALQKFLDHDYALVVSQILPIQPGDRIQLTATVKFVGGGEPDASFELRLDLPAALAEEVK